jgi:hypothetical protein
LIIRRDIYLCVLSAYRYVISFKVVTEFYLDKPRALFGEIFSHSQEFSVSACVAHWVFIVVIVGKEFSAGALEVGWAIGWVISVAVAKRIISVSA